MSPFEDEKFDNLSDIKPQNIEFVDMDIDEGDALSDEDIESIINGTFKNENEDW